MMSVMLKTPPLMSLTDQWSSLFTDFTTVSGSRLFMKKMIAVSMSTITCVRGIFPNRAYGERRLGGLKLKILSEDSGIEGVDKFISLIRSLYDAIDKKYLQQISIGICLDAENKDEVLESYSMTFRYNDEEFSISNKSGAAKINEDDPVVGATFWMLKSILQISDILSELPKSAYLTMKLLYNDEITPKDYEPPGFEPSDKEKFSFPESAVKFKLGDITTDYHACKMYIKSALSKEPLSQLMEQPTLTDSQLSRGTIIDELQQDDYVLETELGSKSDPTDSQPKSVKSIPTKIQCPCTCKLDSGIDILECTICQGQHHSVCYGFMSPDGKESEFYCVQCIDEAPSKNTEQDFIYVYKGKELQELCVFRQALVFCASVKLVTALQLEKGLKCDKQSAKNIIERLESEGFIKKSGLKYIVNENKIKNNGYQEYFPKLSNKEKFQKMSLRKPKNSSQEKSVSGTKISPSQKENLKTKEQVLDHMDFDIDNGVEKLNLKDSSGKRQLRTRKRKNWKNKAGSSDNSEEMFQSLKRRCLNTKETITLP